MRALIEQLLMKLIAALAERKPVKRAEVARAAAEEIRVDGPIESPAAVKPPASWRLPDPVDIDRARGECSAHGLPHVKICRGPGKGCSRHWTHQGDCQDCFVVKWHDKRPSTELLMAMERGDA